MIHSISMEVTHLDGSERQCRPNDIHHDLPQLLHNQCFTTLHTRKKIQTHETITTLYQ